MTESPFHAGEARVQERLGVRDIEQWARQVVRPFLPEEHRAFHAALPFLVAAARDEAGRPWATLLVGEDGFVSSPDDGSLEIAARPVAGDALESALAPGADLGLLGIELATRRRNRVNGRVGARTKDALHFEVGQSFGNCPQYIREREWQRVDDSEPGPAQRGDALSRAQRDQIGAADTFFIASGHRGDGESASFGMDASHRGGEPGFVRVLSDRRLVFPDYAGNNHFNTIGNLELDPGVGLLFVDFTSGSLLQLTGRARIDWDSPAVSKVPGARRLVVIDVDAVVELPAAVPLRWSENAESVRSLRLVAKHPESADVTSFELESRDGGPLADFEPGQHLPIELEVSGQPGVVRRTYSLSNAPGEGRYRISVKREPQGIASGHLHDSLEPGAIIQARTPAGDFILPPAPDPVVLVSAGVGITPVLSMLAATIAEPSERQVWFVHGARDGRHHPFADEVRALAAHRTKLSITTAYSRPDDGDRPDHVGRIDASLLTRLGVPARAHYLVCGPDAFMAEVREGLLAHGVPSERIHAESFGPRG